MKSVSENSPLSPAACTASTCFQGGHRFRRGSLLLSLFLGLSVPGCQEFDLSELPTDTRLTDDDLDGFPDQELDGTVVDCDDSNADVRPNAAEVCDGIDNDCDGITDEGFDNDSDGFKDSVACVSADGDDCNDVDPLIYPGSSERCNFKDDDCDKQTDEEFDQDKDGQTTCGGDCNDDNPSISEEASEKCDGIDNDCDDRIDDGFIDSDNGTSTCVDDDRDGFTEKQGDCDDEDRNRHPDADETCDGTDNDCDDEVDEDFDLDFDGLTTCQDDCDDDSPVVYPGADEVCDFRDNDCNGTIDDGFPDSDSDGFTCDDCAPDDPNRSPGKSEACDGIDNDCDGRTDEDFDSDQDNFPTCETAVADADCDDTNSSINPASPEACDGIDNDCNGEIDEIFDRDLDGSSLCDAEPDCDDSNPLSFPGAEERCDGTDNDCDGDQDEGFDGDGDSFGDCDGIDCDDGDAGVYPGATETCDGIDEDCDAAVDEDFDLDQDGFTTCGTFDDCDDAASDIYPGADEICADGVDNDCNGQVDEAIDSDDDGFSRCGSNEELDCDDNDRMTYPGAVEICNDIDNNCSGGNGDYYVAKTGSADYTSIQSGLLGAPTGCSVVVAPGTYTERIDFGGKAVHLRSESGPDVTIIDGQKSGSVITFKNGEGAGSILDGFTVRNGSGTLLVVRSPSGALVNWAHGGGVYITGASSPTLQNNLFLYNHSDKGGAIYAYLGAVRVLDNVFNGNQCDEFGTVVYFDATSEARFLRNVVEDNSATLEGSYGEGTLQIQATTGTQVLDNRFINNLATYGGAAVLANNTSTLVRGNLFVGNESTESGAAVATLGTDKTVIEQNEFVQNTAGDGGGALLCYGGTSSATANVIRNNTFTDNNGTTQGGALYLLGDCRANILQNYIARNRAQSSAGGYGGAISVENASPNVRNNIIIKNLALYGGGISARGTSSGAKLLNNTVSENSASLSGGGIYTRDATPLIQNNLLTYSLSGEGYFAVPDSGFNAANVGYNDLHGNLTATNQTSLIGSNGNLAVDPAYTSRATENYALTSSSPVRNMGNEAASYNDPDGSRNDMGAYGGPDGNW